MTTQDNPGVIALPPLMYGAALILVLVLRWMWPLPIHGSSAPFWAGLALVALGGGLALSGKRALTAAGTHVNPSLPTTAIVSAGPFRYTRNPLYVALTLLFLGLCAMLNTAWGAIVALPLLTLMHYGVVLREERYLERKFGDGYLRYKASVRRYF